MKKYFPLLIVLFFAACASDKPAQDESKKDLLPASLVNNPHSASGIDTAAYNQLPTMDFADTLHDFGAVKQAGKVNYEFKFVNNGRSPLIISDAKGSCGCTVANFPKDPIAPGASASLNVMFDPNGKQGHVEKSVSVVTNTHRSVHLLYIKADVEETK